MASINKVSVPIWGLFNLTLISYYIRWGPRRCRVSVPIWGLFNLTNTRWPYLRGLLYERFRPHLGII